MLASRADLPLRKLESEPLRPDRNIEATLGTMSDRGPLRSHIGETVRHSLEEDVSRDLGAGGANGGARLPSVPHVRHRVKR